MPSREFYGPSDAPDYSLRLPPNFQMHLDATPITEPVSTEHQDREIVQPETPQVVESQTPTDTQEHIAVPPTAEARQQRFTEIMSCSPDFAAKHLPEFDKAVETSIQRAPSHHEKQSIQRVAGILRWHYFGAPGDPLPDGLAIAEYDDVVQPTFNTRKLFTEACASDAFRQLHEDAQDILKETERHIAERSDTERAEIRAIVSNNPGNALLRSFDAHEQPQVAEVPLSQHERAVEEGKIRRAVMAQFGMDDTTPEQMVSRGGAADTALRRAYWRLDDETRAHQQPQGDHDPFKKAKSYFSGQLVDVHNQYIQKFGKPPCDPQYAHDLLVNHDFSSPTTESDLQLRRELLGGIREVAVAEAAALADPNKLLEYESTYTTLDEGIRMLFRTEQPGASDYEALMTEIETRSAGLVQHEVRPITALHTYILDNFVLPRNRLLAPEGEYVPVRTLVEAGGSHKHLENTTKYYDRAEIQQARQNYVGAVHTGAVPNQRIIQTTEINPSLPKSAPGELTLLLTGDQFAYADPDIPGYTLAGRDDEAYTFTRNPDDPYVAANVPISDVATRALAAEYQHVGLNDLAAKVTQASSLTVEQLRSYIESESNYYIPEQSEHTASGGQINVDEKRLSGFKNVVQGGKLQVQCSGAANFLKASLEKVFGEGSAGVVSGLAISRSTKLIDQAGHQQTSFIHDGRMYILDATPGGNNNFPQQGQAPEVVKQSHAHVSREAAPLETRRLVEPAKSHGEQLQVVRTAFEQQLGLALGIPDQQVLYERIITLPEATDPIRRTMTLSMQATTGSAHKADAVALQGFLKNYSKRSEAELTSMGLPSYDKSMLAILTSTVQRIAENL